MKIHADIDLNGEIKDVTVADRQSKTVNRLLELLADQPGLILGDEVGMGKTFIALATALTYIAQSDRNKRILILTPSKELKDKWDRDIDTFRDYCIKDNSQLKRLARDKGIESIRELLKDKTPILTIPLNRVAGMPKEEEMLCYLGAYFRQRGFSSSKRREMLGILNYDLRTFNDSMVMNPMNWLEVRRLEEFVTYETFKEKSILFESFDNTIRKGCTEKEFKEACTHIRNQLIPEFSFCIIDEAHNYKNPWTVGHKLFNNDSAPDTTLKNKFGKMLFLTATPFQLGYDELINIFKMFYAAKTCPANYKNRVGEVKELLENYKKAMDIFEEAWRKFSLYPERDITNEYECAKRAKRELEIELRKFMVRNVKDKGHRKVIYGACNNGNINSAGIDIPDKDKPLFYSLLRLENEIGRDNKTFRGLTDSMATSAYSTLRESKMIKELIPQGDNIISKYQQMICELISMQEDDNHPKINDVVDSVIDRYKRGEKSLIFTFYIKTAEALRKVIEGRINSERSTRLKRITGKLNIEKYIKNNQKMFNSARDIRYLIMRENLLLTHYKTIFDGDEIIPDEEDWKQITKYLGNNNYKFMDTKRDFRLLLKVVEHHFFKKAVKNKSLKEQDNIVKRVIEDDYIQYGLYKTDEDRKSTKQNKEVFIYTIRNEDIEYVKGLKAISYILKGPNNWSHHKEVLSKIDDIELRRLAQNYVTREMIREDLILEKFIAAKYQEEDAWINVINRIYTEDAIFNNNSETLKQRIDRWLGLITTKYERLKKGDNTEEDINKLRDIIREHTTRNYEDVSAIHGNSNVDRSVYFEAFNSPFRPVILICTSIGSEGIDLQHECSAVYLYDLGWNPAALEQKVGRIDRIGSKNQRESQASINKEHLPKIEIYRPFIKGTRDERMHRVLQNREKWFNFLLGTGARLSDDENGDAAKFEVVNKEENMMPLPEWRVKELTLNLGTDYAETNV